MNQLTIIGNLVADPELRTTPKGKNVCDFTVAVNRRKINGEDQGADFFRVSAWGERGENCAKYLSKGRKVCVVGSVSCRAYKAKNGDPAASLEVKAEEVEFLSTRSESPENAAKNDVKKDEQTGFEDVTSQFDGELPF